MGMWSPICVFFVTFLLQNRCRVRKSSRSLPPAPQTSSSTSSKNETADLQSPFLSDNTYESVFDPENFRHSNIPRHGEEQSLMLDNVGLRDRDLDPRIDESKDDESEIYDSEEVKTRIKGHLYETRIVNRGKQRRHGFEAESACKYSPQNENVLTEHRTTDKFDKSLTGSHVFSSDGTSSDGSNAQHFEHIYYTADDELGNDIYEKPRSPSSKDTFPLQALTEGVALAPNTSPSPKKQPTSSSASSTVSLGTTAKENTPPSLSGSSIECKQGEGHFSSDEESTHARVNKDPNYVNMSPLPSSSSGEDCDNESHNILHTYYSVDDLS